jgi:PAS domain-containing protein
MAQIKSMNKTIRNTYSNNLTTEVDKTGFIIVKGTFAEFGQILFANRTLGTMLGYYPEELVGKLINTFMP